MSDDLDKAGLRRRMRQVRGALDPASLPGLGRAVAARVLELDEVRGARQAMVYLSVRREVPTAELIAALQREGVAIAVPRVVGSGVMEARALVEPLERGVLGIPTSAGPVVSEVDVCVCPGLAFDRRGGRLGYGGGYYDAWLTRIRPLTVGVCLDEALLDAVPVQDHDVRMRVVVTPTRTVRVPIRVVAGAWVREGQLLAAQRAPEARHPGQWELPGGKVEPGESDAEALVREWREELGVDIAVGEQVGVVRHAYADDAEVEIVAYRVWAPAGGEPRALEHAAVRWLPAGRWREVPWVAADEPLVDALAKQRAPPP